MPTSESYSIFLLQLPFISRLAAGIIDNLLGKLRAIFAVAGLGGEWDDRSGIGNPVSHPSIKNYLKLIEEEQAKARIFPKKAVP